MHHVWTETLKILARFYCHVLFADFANYEKTLKLTGLLAGLYILMAQFFDLAFFLVSDVLSRNLNYHEKAWKEKAWEMKELDLLCGKSFENQYGVLKVITPSCWLLLCFLTHQ